MLRPASPHAHAGRVFRVLRRRARGVRRVPAAAGRGRGRVEHALLCGVQPRAALVLFAGMPLMKVCLYVALAWGIWSIIKSEF